MTYQPFSNLPTITFVAHHGKLMALDWYTQKTEKILNKLKQQAKFVAPTDLDSASQDVDATMLHQVMRELKDYFSGERQTFSVPLDLSLGTPFQQKVWQALLEIPYGQTISYAQLAQNIGQPKAFRAVASANAKNPISLIVPCHRVIATGGGIGGYTGGIEIKRQLLMLENSSLKLS